MLLDGKVFNMYAGEMHPSRIPYQYWRHRVQMAKAMGCNTIAIYTMWNYHEREDLTFDFSSPQKNISRFAEIVQEEDMWLAFRPGPYSCAEWDFGGIPVRLLANTTM